MKKVLLLTYFYPPCNVTAAQRPHSWAHFLPESGYEPFVVTRHWDEDQQGVSDLSAGGSDQRESVVREGIATVYRMPYAASRRDQLIATYGANRKVIQRKAMSLMERIREQRDLSKSSVYNLYLKARQLLSKYPDMRKLVITAKPFILFHIGYQLRKDFPDLQWVADYRDGWTGSDVEPPIGFGAKLLESIDRKAERKWLSNAACFTTVSPYYIKMIGRANRHVRGELLLNGYWEAARTAGVPKPDKFILTYNGTLYPSQRVEFFLSAFRRLADAYSGRIGIELRFPGLQFLPEQGRRVKSLLKGYESHLLSTNRIGRDKVLEMQSESDLLLMFSHHNSVGIPSSKLYEYIGLRKPVLVCPDDGDIIRATLDACGTGFYANNEEEVFQLLSARIEDKLAGRTTPLQVSDSAIQSYSRKSQASVLAGILDGL